MCIGSIVLSSVSRVIRSHRK